MFGWPSQVLAEILKLHSKLLVALCCIALLLRTALLLPSWFLCPKIVVFLQLILFTLPTVFLDEVVCGKRHRRSHRVAPAQIQIHFLRPSLSFFLSMLVCQAATAAAAATGGGGGVAVEERYLVHKSDSVVRERKREKEIGAWIENRIEKALQCFSLVSSRHSVFDFYFLCVARCRRFLFHQDQGRKEIQIQKELCCVAVPFPIIHTTSSKKLCPEECAEVFKFSFSLTS